MLYVYVCVINVFFFSPSAGDGVLWCWFHHRFGEEHQRKHPEGGLDRLHLQRDSQGRLFFTFPPDWDVFLGLVRSGRIGVGVTVAHILFLNGKDYHYTCMKGLIGNMFVCTGIGSPARSSRHPPWHQGTKRAADWKRWSQAGYELNYSWAADCERWQMTAAPDSSRISFITVQFFNVLHHNTNYM